MDLSALFGPPLVGISKEQVEAITNAFDGDDVVGYMLRNDGAGTVTAVALRATVEGGRAIPTESEPDTTREVIVGTRGDTYETDGTPESFDKAFEQAVEAQSDLLKEIETVFDAQEKLGKVETPVSL